ncbi:NAD(P)/FAD-dependent oxidoreductase [Paludibacterium paludis]|uniref:Membrane protein n=1 Tax=Paludibacterium paludis TaxID=1225769 RepID=A0A918U9U3_9NEIS|nr:NAD(P)/FAD-dependent oxidoreductase [Paludibacterium paludis]GGY13590.1 membrane protein [Paludibacterium paludis]
MIGAGAAGLMCAATAGQRGRSVLLLDHAVKLAEKIRISGGGRCNFTNLDVRPECFLSENPHFCRSALSQYTAHDFLALLERYGIHWHEKTLGQLFCDDGSQAIIDMLDAECRAGGVERRMGVSIEDVSRSDGFEVRTSEGVFRSESLVVATGGLSIPQIGATGLGYRIAGAFGLDVTECAPALVPLTFHADEAARFAPLAGVSFCAEAEASGPVFRENVLFTHKGVSGPAILQVSSYWMPGEPVSLDLMPGKSARAFLDERSASEQRVVNALAEAGLPRRFAQAWAEQEGVDVRLCDLSAPAREALAARLHAWEIRPNGTQGYRKAEVTRGGVSTRALSSKTMMARDVPGLFFVGEVVDVTGWLGGYNFQWAWSSGFVAGKNC